MAEGLSYFLSFRHAFIQPPGVIIVFFILPFYKILNVVIFIRMFLIYDFDYKRMNEIQK